MVIVYCEKCGMRVSEDQLQSGLAICSSENRYYCKNCTGSLTKTEREAAQPANAVHAQTPQPGTLKNRVHARAAGRASSAGKGVDKMWLYNAGIAAVLLLAFVLLGGSRRPPNVAKTEPAKTPPTSTAAQPRTGSSRVVAASEPAAPTVEDPVRARLRESDRQFVIMREQRGLKLLEEAQAFTRTNPNDAWGYRDQLEKIVGGYRSTPAAEQATKILATLKMPEGPRPAPAAPAPPAATVATIPAGWTGEPGADGWRPILDGKSPPFRGTRFGAWKYENGVLVSSGKTAEQTSFSFGDGDIRIRFEVDKSSWVEFSFHQSDEKPGANLGFNREILEPLWNKPLELVVSCRGDTYEAKFNGQTTPVNFNGCERSGRLHINNSIGSMRVVSIDFRPPADK